MADRPISAAKQTAHYAAFTYTAAGQVSVHDIFGNPFRPVAFDTTWRTATVMSLAEAIYTDRAFERLPILADALEDAGCTSAAVLEHCRGAGAARARLLGGGSGARQGVI